MSCDAYVKTFGPAFARNIGLAVLDEAHQFTGLLGGNVRELLKRMRELQDTQEQNNDSKSMRVILASATICKPDKFSEKLLEKDSEIVEGKLDKT